MTKIGLWDVKKALKDSRFRESLPVEFKHKYEKELVKFLSDPGCTCNIALYRALFREAVPQLREYYPNREVVSEEEEIKQLSTNHWTVINCKADELEDRLRRLPNGRKQIAIARYEDEVTVVVNELDILMSS